MQCPGLEGYVVASEPYGVVEETPTYLRMDGDTPADPERAAATRGQVVVLGNLFGRGHANDLQLARAVFSRKRRGGRRNHGSPPVSPISPRPSGSNPFATRSSDDQESQIVPAAAATSDCEAAGVSVIALQ